MKISQQNSKLSIETEQVNIVFNTRKGLAIEKLIFPNINSKPLLGTLPHGYFDNISFGADFFSGSSIIESPGQPKVTDLEIIEPEINEQDTITVQAIISTRIGIIKKQIKVFNNEPKVELTYNFDLKMPTLSSVRVGIITLMPEAFDKDSLFYKTVNGGFLAEKFNLKNKAVKHQESVNALISSGHCLGATDGWIELGDKDKYIRIQTNKEKCYNTPMIQYQNVDNSYFCRVYHSLQEIDETSKPGADFCREIKFTLTGYKNNI